MLGLLLGLVRCLIRLSGELLFLDLPLARSDCHSWFASLLASGPPFTGL